MLMDCLYHHVVVYTRSTVVSSVLFIFRSEHRTEFGFPKECNAKRGHHHGTLGQVATYFLSYVHA
jgi:hypothetical protein